MLHNFDSHTELKNTENDFRSDHESGDNYLTNK